MLEGSFRDIRLAHQSAPVDFTRSSRWRRDYGKPGFIDYIILKLEGSKILALISFLAAWLRLTNRVSVKCLKI